MDYFGSFITLLRSISIINSWIGRMQDKDAEDPTFKPLHYSQRTADRPNHSPQPNDPPPMPLFDDPESPSTRGLNLARPALLLRDCYRLRSDILQGTPISQNMRARLRSFLISESSKQLLLRETCVLACGLVDLFFARGGRVEVNEFQSLVIGCLILGCKIKEGKLPTISFNIFSREQLLAFEKRVARKLAYNLAPPTYHDYAQRAVHLWDCFAKDDGLGGQFSDCPQGVNLRLRQFYEQLDCVFLVLKSLDFEVETLVLNLLYLHTRTTALRTSSLSALSLLPDDKFKCAAYPPNDPFRNTFDEFLQSHSWTVPGKLDPQVGLFLRPFLGVQVGQREWMIGGNSQAIEMMRVWDRIQTAPKDNYQLAKAIMDRAPKKK